jgi:hypothetical protein
MAQLLVKHEGDYLRSVVPLQEIFFFTAACARKFRTAARRTWAVKFPNGKRFVQRT